MDEVVWVRSFPHRFMHLNTWSQLVLLLIWSRTYISESWYSILYLIHFTHETHLWIFYLSCWIFNSIFISIAVPFNVSISSPNPILKPWIIFVISIHLKFVLFWASLRQSFFLNSFFLISLSCFFVFS